MLVVGWYVLPSSLTRRSGDQPDEPATSKGQTRTHVTQPERRSVTKIAAKTTHGTHTPDFRREQTAGPKGSRLAGPRALPRRTQAIAPKGWHWSRGLGPCPTNSNQRKVWGAINIGVAPRVPTLEVHKTRSRGQDAGNCVVPTGSKHVDHEILLASWYKLRARTGE